MNTLLVADIGGTYARFAIARSSEPDRPGIGHPAGGPMTIGPIWSAEVRSRNSAVEAIRDFLAVDSLGARIDGALLAVAGPVEGGRCRLTNAAWTIDEEEIAHAFSIPWVRIVNDLEAAAAGLPELAASQTFNRQVDAAVIAGRKAHADYDEAIAGLKSITGPIVPAELVQAVLECAPTVRAWRWPNKRPCAWAWITKPTSARPWKRS